MANNKIMETPQYQIYLKVLEALKQGGYEIEGKINNYTVTRGNESYGNVFVVDHPNYLEDNPGCGCLVSIIPGIKDLLNMFRSFSDYETMKRIVEDVNNSRKRGKTYWPKDSLVGGYTTDMYGHKYNDEWLKILESIVSKYA